MQKIKPLNLKKEAAHIIPVGEEDITKADYSKALIYKEINTINDIKDGVSKPYELSVPNEDLSKYGIGVYLYFEFMQRAAIVFILMAGIAIVAMVSNSQGDGLQQYKDASQLMLLSAANQPMLYIEVTNSTNSTFTDEVAKRNNATADALQSEMKEKHLMLSLIDLGYTLIFLAFIIHFTYSSERLIRESEQRNVLPCQFSIVVSGFPERVVDASLLRQFVSKYAEVFEVVLARNYHNTLFLHKEESELMLRVKMERMKKDTPQFSPKKIEGLLNQVAKIKESLAKTLQERLGTGEKSLKHDQYPSIQAFIIFMTYEERLKFITSYRSATAIPFCNLFIKYEVPEEHKFEGALLEIEPRPDNPSDVIWENIEVSGWQRGSRLCLVFFLVLCFMVITFGIIFAANIVQPRDASECPQSAYTYKQTLTLVAAAKTTSQKELIKDCFCMSQSLQALYADSTITSYCDSVITRYSINTGIAIGSAFVILIVNAMLQWLIRTLGSFVRYPSLSKEYSGTMINLFVVLFINTALITLLLQADIFSFKPAIILSQPIPPLAQAQEQSVQSFASDLDRSWYNTVGTKIINTWVINTVSPHLIAIFLMPFQRCSRDRKVKNAVVQRDMNRWIVGEEFTLTLYYAQALNTIFVTMFYCSGMPLMLAFGSCSLFLQFLGYKYIFLRNSRKPPTFDDQLHQKAMAVLPFSVILHLMIAIYVYGTNIFFPTNALTSNISYAYFSFSASGYNSNSQIILGRLINTPWLSLLLILMIVYYIFQSALIAPLKMVCYNKFSSNNKVHNLSDQTPPRYEEQFEAINHYTLATYEIRANEHYKDIVSAMDTEMKSAREGGISQDEHDNLIEGQQTV